MLVERCIADSVIDFIPFNERVIMLKLQTSRRVMNAIHVHAPTLDKEDDITEGFYNTVQRALGETRNGEMTLILGDFNAKSSSTCLFHRLT